MLRCSAVSRIRLAPWVQLSALSTSCGHSCLRCTRNGDVALRRGPSYRCALMAATHHHHHHHQQQQRTISTRSDKAAEEESVDGPSPANDHDNNNNEHSSHAVQLLRIVHDAVPLSRTEDILRMVKDCKNAKELHHVLLHEAYRHHLCWDLLNGHGYRVALIQAVTSVAPRLSAMEAWYDCMYRCRQMGFLMTRSFAAEGLAILRQWLMSTFQNDGRHPRLVTEGIAHLRELLHWCRCDCLVLDYVLYTRIVFLLTMMVSFFDRQNLYRSTFQPDFVKRDGVVVEWIMANERCVDYDECVLQCDAFLEEMLQRMREDLPSRPTFSFTYRLIDYFFAADNVDKMIAVMEDAQSYGTAIAESSTAKLMQLACAFNYINVPEMFLRWRVALPQCVMATPDMSRLLFFYARAGGGLPCPLCGEAFNHRNVSVYQWMQTPPHQRSCPALRMARRQKGELEEHRQLPQTQDRSHVAFALWDLSVARSIEWGPVEWRGFLLCCIFSPRAMEARGLMQQHLAAERMDDFLRATNMRLLRHHAPEEAVKELKQWQEMRCKISPIVLQECLMAAANVRLDASTRFRDVLHVWRCVQQKDSYIMPFTRRFMERRASELHESWHSEEEQSLFRAIISMQPRHVSLLDMKDSASDFVIGSTKKNVYLDASLQAARAQRWASASS